MRGLVIGAALCCAAAVQAQDIVPPPPGTLEEGFGCQVARLDPNGDGFLAVRTGPGSSYPQIGSLHNGDAAVMSSPCAGRWCYSEYMVKDNRVVPGMRGWFYDAWCEFYP